MADTLGGAERRGLIAYITVYSSLKPSRTFHNARAFILLVA